VSISGSGYSDDPRPFLNCDGKLRALLDGTPIVRIFGDTVFLHGGISKPWTVKASRLFAVMSSKNDFKLNKATPECNKHSTIEQCTISGNNLIRGLNEAAMSVLWNKANRYCSTTDDDYIVYMAVHPRSIFDNHMTSSFFQGNEADAEVMISSSDEQDQPTDCPLWHRRWIYSITDKRNYPLDKQAYADTLKALGANRMVMGHQIIDDGITVSNGGTLIGIDAGQTYALHINGLNILKIEYEGKEATKISTIKYPTAMKGDPTVKLEWSKPIVASVPSGPIVPTVPKDPEDPIVPTIPKDPKVSERPKDPKVSEQPKDPKVSEQPKDPNSL